MDKLLLELAQERDADLIDKMVDVWIQFYTSILPTLSAIFASLQVRPHPEGGGGGGGVEEMGGVGRRGVGDG